jgi:hypothetical protein
VDVAALNLPKGLTIYPGATNVDTSGIKGSSGMNSLTFHTMDSSDQVTIYYNKQLNQAGWTTSSGPANTPGPGGRQVWSWTSSSLSVVSLMATDHPGGGTDVTITWIVL